MTNWTFSGPSCKTQPLCLCLCCLIFLKSLPSISAYEISSFPEVLVNTVPSRKPSWTTPYKQPNVTSFFSEPGRHTTLCLTPVMSSALGSGLAHVLVADPQWAESTCHRDELLATWVEILTPDLISMWLSKNDSTSLYLDFLICGEKDKTNIYVSGGGENEVGPCYSKLKEVVGQT